MQPVTHDSTAHEYDYLAKESEFYASDILFGLLYEYVKKGQSLLDLGIGTGLSSLLFHQIGLKIYGIDISEEMLTLCREKGIAEELKKGDLTNTLPYNDNEFHHVISVGVFLFFNDLTHFFEESQRVLKKGGTFSFMVESPQNTTTGVSQRYYEGITVYQHSQQYIHTLMKQYTFELLKKQSFQSYNDPSKTIEITFQLFILKKW